MSAIYYELPDYDDDVLMHHGILGMKWGIRRFQNKDGSLNATGKKRYATGDKNSGKPKHSARRKSDTKTRIHSMSEEELRKRLQHLDLEKKYLDIEKSIKSYGRVSAESVLKSIGFTAATASAVIGATLSGIKLYDKIMKFY